MLGTETLSVQHGLPPSYASVCFSHSKLSPSYIRSRGFYGGRSCNGTDYVAFTSHV